MEENSRGTFSQEEFEAMRQRYARELLAIRRSVDAMLGHQELSSAAIQQSMPTTEPEQYPMPETMLTQLPTDDKELSGDMLIPQPGSHPNPVDCQGNPVSEDNDYEKDLTYHQSDDTGDYDPEDEELPPDDIEELAPPNGTMPPLTDTATIQVMVTAAQQAVPIEGATVLVSRVGEDGLRHLIQAMITDSSGKTPILTVSAPSRELTQQPGNVYPFVSYQAVVTAPGYLSQSNNNVTVFGGMSSLLSMALLPLIQPLVPPPNSGGSDGSLFF